MNKILGNTTNNNLTITVLCNIRFENVHCSYINLIDSKYSISSLKAFGSSCCHYSQKCDGDLLLARGRALATPPPKKKRATKVGVGSINKEYHNSAQPTDIQGFEPLICKCVWESLLILSKQKI